MTTKLIKMDLQKFASSNGEIDIPDDLAASIKEMTGLDIGELDVEDIDDVDDDEEVEEDEDLDDIDEELEEDEDTDDDVDEDLDDDNDDEEEDKTDRKAAIAERKKWQERMRKRDEEHNSEIEALTGFKEIVNQLSVLTGKDPDKLSSAMIDARVGTLVKEGMKEDLAREHVNLLISNATGKTVADKASKTQKLSDLDKKIETLAKDNSNYSGVLDHKSEVAKFALEKDLTVDAAYRVLYPKEFEKKMTKATKLERKYSDKKRRGAKVVTSKGAGSMKSKSNLTNEQKAEYAKMGVNLNTMSKMKGVSDIDSFRKVMKPSKKKG